MSKRIKNYQFTKVLGFNDINGEMCFLVEWNGPPNIPNTWEPISDFDDRLDLSNKLNRFFSSDETKSPASRYRTTAW